MKSPKADGQSLQIVAGTKSASGNRSRKPKHLSWLKKRICIDTYRMHQSEEDAAKAIAELGITGKTIISTALLDALNRIETIEQMTGIRRAA